MRFLFTFAGGNGHFQPLIPIARAAQQGGHEVIFAGQAAMAPVIEAAGFTALVTAGDTLRAEPERLPLLRLDLERENRALREGFATRLARKHAAETLALCGQWQPDLLVCDEVDFGALIAAEQLGIPYASVLVIASGLFITREVVGEALNGVRAEFGLPPDPELRMLSRYLVLAPFPPSFRHPYHPLPPTAHSYFPKAVQADLKPSQEVESGGLPLVYFTLGTIFNIESGDLFERVLMGLRGLPVRIVATVGREIDPAVFGPQPAQIQIERYIAQDEILPGCALAVTHGGSGSVIGALAHGVPMVLLPLGADQPHNAARCAELGAARVLDAFDATPETVQEAVSAVLADPAYRRNAQRLQAEIAALPGPKLALGLLERLAVEKRPIVLIDG